MRPDSEEHGSRQQMVMKAVLFDLGGTLIKTPPASEILAGMLMDFGVTRSSEEIEEARRTAEQQSNMAELPILGEAFWHRWNVRILEHLRIREGSHVLAERMVKEWWRYAKAELYPDVEKTLVLLRERRLKVGLVTNGLESDVREVLPQVGLTGFFDVEVTSNLAGKIKPHRGIFMHALGKLGVAPEEAIHVGDLLEADYRGARSCGLKALLIDRDDHIRDPGVEKIRTLTELLVFI